MSCVHVILESRATRGGTASTCLICGAQVITRSSADLVSTAEAIERIPFRTKCVAKVAEKETR